MSLHVDPGDFYFILDSRLTNVWEKKLSSWLSACKCFDRGAVALSASSSLPVGVLEGRY